MAKRITGQIKLQIMAGKATPAPPVGPALGQAGVNIMDFCKAFNAKTSERELEGLIVPVVITVYHDRSFSFITKTPPAAVLIKRAANLAKGSGEPNRTKVGELTRAQVEEIAKVVGTNAVPAKEPAPAFSGNDHPPHVPHGIEGLAEGPEVLPVLLGL